MRSTRSRSKAGRATAHHSTCEIMRRSGAKRCFARQTQWPRRGVSAARTRLVSCCALGVRSAQRHKTRAISVHAERSRLFASRTRLRNTGIICSSSRRPRAAPRQPAALTHSPQGEPAQWALPLRLCRKRSRKTSMDSVFSDAFWAPPSPGGGDWRRAIEASGLLRWQRAASGCSL